MDLATGPTTATMESTSSGAHMTSTAVTSNGSWMWPAVCGNETLWDRQQSFQTNYPIWTDCMQNTLITWVACGFLVLLNLFYLVFLFCAKALRELDLRQQNSLEACSRCPRSKLNKAKSVVGVLLMAISIIEVIFVAVKGHRHQYLPFILASCLRFVTVLLPTVAMSLEFRQGIYSSGTMSIFWLIYTIFSTIPVYTYGMLKYHDQWNLWPINANLEPVWIGLRSVYLILAVIQLIMTCCSDSKLVDIFEIRPRVINDGNAENMPLLASDTQVQQNVSPQLSACYFSRLTFLWVTPMLVRGFMNAPTYETLYDLLPGELCKSVLATFNRHMRSLITGSESSRYMWCLFKCTGMRVFYAAFLRLMTIVLLFINLIIFRQLIQIIHAHNNPLWQGILFACLLFIVTAIRGFMCAHWLYQCDLVGMHLRSLITTTIYRKVLKMSTASVSGSMDTGCVINLLSVDALKISQMVRASHEIVTLPIYLALSATFLYINLKSVATDNVSPYASLIGMCVMVTLVPLTTFIVAWRTKLIQTEQMDLKNNRLKLMNEILAGIKVIKLYAWEKYFERKVTEIRNAELWCLLRASLWNAVANVTCLLSPYLVALVMFGSYVYLGTGASGPHSLDAGVTFVCLSLVCLLNYNVSTLPSSVNYVIQGVIAVKFAAGFMDLSDTNVDRCRELQAGGGIKVRDGSFSWGQEEPTLKNINFEVGRGKLVAVVGTVGSGKSSLLYSLLGEMTVKSGTVIMQKNVAYVSQQAWVQQGTFCDNVCFGKPYSKNRFDRIVAACALDRDLAQLPGGMRMELGGKGVNLSGGQKQRVNLARAVYQDADVYLIDDALSAVDPNVGKHIFQQCIGPKGLLKEKTRVFATNSLTFLPDTDLIIVMEDGCIREMGSYERLRRSDGKFAQLLRDHVENDEEHAERERAKQQRDRGAAKRSDSTPKSWRRRKPTVSTASDNQGNLARNHLQTWNPARAQLTAEFLRNTRSTVLSNFMFDDVRDDEELGAVDPVHLVQVEKFDTGFIGWNVIGSYIKAGGWVMFILLVVSHLVIIGSQAMANIWLCMWSDNEGCMPKSWLHSLNGTRLVGNELAIYGGLGIVEAISVVVDCIVVSVAFYVASRNLHQGALYPLFRAPMSFFDTNPLGRILNYFSTDMDTSDLALPLDVQLWLIAMTSLLSTVVTVAYAAPVFLAIILPLLALNVFVQRVYSATSIALKRLYALKKSPLYSHFEETLCGTATVRAYRKQNEFMEQCDKLTDVSHKPWHQYVVAWRWYTTYNEMIGSLAIFLTAAVAVAWQEKHELGAGQVGLALFSVFQVLPYIPIASRVMIEMEANLVAVARIKQYSGIDLEAPWEKADRAIRSHWPEKGSIEFRDYATRYRPGLELCLKNVSGRIKAGEKCIATDLCSGKKQYRYSPVLSCTSLHQHIWTTTMLISAETQVGIVGRTGAGKSSIALSLFRILEAAAGGIDIDGVDISEIGLHDLRSRITIIPQEPVLFSGPLRQNLDPLELYADAEIWNALEHAHLKDFIMDAYPEGLEYIVSNEEFSVGQRQLLCMARALLRKSKVIVMDEATAGVDYETDELIQQTIREAFKESTVLTVAHRLATIIDYNRVMVFDKGQLKEFASPQSLLDVPTSLFASMAKDVVGLRSKLVVVE